MVKDKKTKSEREFETTDNEGNKVKLLCIRPNQDVIDWARLEYNVKYAEALRAKCLMRIEADKMCEERKMWSETHEQMLQSLRLQLRTLEVDLKKEKDIIKGKELAKRVAKKRDEITKLMGPRNDLYNRTAESLAESAQNQYLVVRCTLEPDSREAFFTSVEKFKELENSQLIQDCLAELMLFLMDLSTDDLVNTPEHKWLTEHGLKDQKTGFWIVDGKLYDDQNRCVNTNGEFINKDTGEKVDEFGFLLEDTNGQQEVPTTETASSS